MLMKIIVYSVQNNTSGRMMHVFVEMEHIKMEKSVVNVLGDVMYVLMGNNVRYAVNKIIMYCLKINVNVISSVILLILNNNVYALMDIIMILFLILVYHAQKDAKLAYPILIATHVKMDLN